jgi:F-type H+-transporting ATPase subunit alpha
MEEQVVVLYAGTNGFIDDYPVSAIGRYERELLQFLRTRKKPMLDALRAAGTLDDAMEKQLRDSLTEFAKTFSVEDEK